MGSNKNRFVYETKRQLAWVNIGINSPADCLLFNQNHSGDTGVTKIMQLTALSKACYKSIPVRCGDTMVFDKQTFKKLLPGFTVTTTVFGVVKPGKQIARIMKLTAFILLTACFAASASGGYSQITLVEKNAPLQKVFK